MYRTGGPITLVSTTTVKAHAKWLMGGEPHPYIKSHRKVERFEDAWHACEVTGARSLGLVRHFALGDVLMLIPIARALTDALGLEFVKIITREQYWRQIRGAESDRLRFWRVDQWTFDYGCDIHIDLNGALQADHLGGEESNYHRCELYGQWLGIEVNREP